MPDPQAGCISRVRLHAPRASRPRDSCRTCLTVLQTLTWQNCWLLQEPQRPDADDLHPDPAVGPDLAGGARRRGVRPVPPRARHPGHPGRRGRPAGGPGRTQRLPGAHRRRIRARALRPAPHPPPDGPRARLGRGGDGHLRLLRIHAGRAGVLADARLHRHRPWPLSGRGHGAVAAAGDQRRQPRARRGAVVHGALARRRQDPGARVGPRQGPVPERDEPRAAHADERGAGRGRAAAPPAAGAGRPGLCADHHRLQRDPAAHPVGRAWTCRARRAASWSSRPSRRS